VSEGRRPGFSRHTSPVASQGLNLTVPDLITVDLSMPEHDGIATFLDLRSNPETEAIPVCIVNGHAEMRALIYERPARPPEGYMDRPIDPKRVVGTIRRILDLRQRRRRDR